ncbi:GPP34 family phosphoprotein [Streptomyces polygonati]|uniref:GPP34 family phosphoprotein n=1 Tax=Streptomyces polygonati TaxID=1617087 RepID=A0ABV8HTR1_9ACTN
METLGEDILLLAIRPNGTIGASAEMRFALSGSELVRLAGERRIEIVKDRIVVLDSAPTGDALLDAALLSIGSSRRPPRPKAWVARERKRLVETYLERLAAAGVVRAERRKALGLFPVTRWAVVDVGRLAGVSARLDGIARSSGPVGSAEAALGGLVHAIGLDALLYPGWDGRAARRRLKEIARRDRTAKAVRAAADGVGDAASHISTAAASAAATDAAVGAATDAAIRASVQAATDAAVSAAVDSAVDSAISASVDATHHAATHDSGGGGHHH